MFIPVFWGAINAYMYSLVNNESFQEKYLKFHNRQNNSLYSDQ